MKDTKAEYYTYSKDVQGSTSMITGEDKKAAAVYDYDEFGETSTIGEATIDNQICYTGGVYDEKTGLYYLNARYYDPSTGRFISQDTYRGEIDDPGQWHLYAYCANNPINYVDTSGHSRHKNYSASHSFTYSLSWGKLYINLVVKWQVKNKKIVDCYSYVSRKS